MLQGVICKLYRLYIARHFIRFRGQSFWTQEFSLSLSSVISWGKNLFPFHKHMLTSFGFEAGLGADCPALCQKAPRQVLGGSWGLNPSTLCPMWKVAWESHSKGRLDSEDRRKNLFATETFAVLAQAVFPRESKQTTQAKTNGFDEMDMPSHQVPGGKFPSICFRDFVVWWHGVWIAQFNIFTL